MTMTENYHARMVAQLGAKLDSAVALGEDWDAAEPIVRSLAGSFGDALATEMLRAHGELRPRPSAAVVEFDEGFTILKAREFGKAVREVLKQSPEIHSFHQIVGQLLAEDLVGERVEALLDAASTPGGCA